MKGSRHGTGIKTPDFSSNNDLKLVFRNWYQSYNRKTFQNDIFCTYTLKTANQNTNKRNSENEYNNC
jgi:hypothetical protein